MLAFFNFSIVSRLGLWLQNITLPTSRREDDARREHILSVLLVFLSTLSLLFTVSMASLAIKLGTARDGVSLTFSIFITGFFLALFAIVKTGRWKISRYIFLSAIIAPTLYSFARWGTLLPIPLLTLSLIIILTGILLNTRSAILMAGALGSYLGALSYAQQNGLLSVDKSWMAGTLYANYSVEIAIVLLMISGVVWLAYREIENSLRRARRSEALIKKERDTLEARVIERTDELKRAHIKELKTVSRMAEIGKLSAGLFHDLINPLTAVTLHLDQLNKNNSAGAEEIRKHIGRAVSATNRLSDLTERIRRELSGGQDEKQTVFLKDAIKNAIDAVQHIADQTGVVISFFAQDSTRIHVHLIHIHRAIVNLLSNAIEACAENDELRPRKVTVSFTYENENCTLAIQDTGCGIDPAVLPHIFDPFFSAKTGQGIGLGLYISKELLFQELEARISVTSKPEFGTECIVVWKKNNTW